MTPLRLPLLALALAACSEAPSGPPAAPAPSSDAAATAPAPPTPQAPVAGRRIASRDDLLTFDYAWPAEAAAIPALAARFEREAAAARGEALETAREDKAARGADAPYHGHDYGKAWEVTGNGRRLLALSAMLSTFTGGAHPNAVFETLIWDRDAGSALPFADLFADAEAARALIEPAYCKALDDERAAKRQETLPLTGSDWEVACPRLMEAPVALVDDDGDRRFERLRVMLAPYEAGPYAEGAYEIELVPDPRWLTLLKPELRADFS